MFEKTVRKFFNFPQLLLTSALLLFLKGIPLKSVKLPNPSALNFPADLKKTPPWWASCRKRQNRLQKMSLYCTKSSCVVLSFCVLPFVNGTLMYCNYAKWRQLSVSISVPVFCDILTRLTKCTPPDLLAVYWWKTNENSSNYADVEKSHKLCVHSEAVNPAKRHVWCVCHGAICMKFMPFS